MYAIAEGAGIVTIISKILIINRYKFSKRVLEILITIIIIILKK